jgi:collagenase-like PrtC family protease
MKTDSSQHKFGKTKFCVPCNWDYGLLDSLDSVEIHSLYGKLSHDEIGGGRPFYKLPKPTKKFAVNYINLVRKKAINFNYLLNSSCTGNNEFTKDGHKAIIELLSWIVSAGANYVTVAIPYIAELVKKKFPKIKISASKMAFISTTRQAKFWEDLGADEITINPDINRNLKRLEQIKKSVSCDLILLVNEACLYHCPYVYYHVNSDSHASQTGNIKTYICYSRIFCEETFTRDKSEIIKSTFIRPEDLNFYEEIGVRRFKLVGRSRPTEWILNALNAYSLKKYEGNLAQILGTFSLHHEVSSGNLKDFIKLNDIKSFETLEELRKSTLFRPHISIDNRKLDNFFKYFKYSDCENTTCEKCGYCKRYANKTVFIDKRERQRVLKNLRKLRQWVNEGRVINLIKN